MRRGKTSDKTTEKKITFASSEQIAKIQSLEININHLIEKINNPYSSLVSIIFFPALFSSLFLYRYSPFHRLYTETFQNYYDSFYADNLKSINMENPTNTMEQTQWYIDQLERLCDYVLPKPCNLDQTLGDFEHSKTGIEYAKRFKPNMLHLYNALTIDFQYLGEKIIPQEKALQISFKSLYKHLKEKLPRFKKVMTRFTHNVTHLYTEGEVTTEIDKFMIAGKIILAMLGKQFIVNPLFNRYFSNGVWQTTKPKLATALHLLNQDQANLHISHLEKHKRILDNKAKCNVNISRLLLLMAIPFTLQYLWNLSANNYPSAEIVLIFISVLGTALTNALTEARDFYNNKVLNYQINNQHKSLEELFEPYNIEIEATRNETLLSSYFLLTCNRLDNISKRNLAKIIKNVFLFNKIDYLERGDNKLIISVHQTINAKKIKESLHNLIEKNKSIKKFQLQLIEIIRALDLSDDNFIFISEHKANFEPDLICKILLDKGKTISNSFIELLTKLVTTNQIALQEEENFFRITIQGIAPFDNAIFHEIMSLKNTNLPIEVKPEQTSSLQTLFFQAASKQSKPIIKRIKIEATTETEKPENKIITNNANYPDNWYPIRSSMLKNEKMFVTTTLTSQDFPDEFNFDKFNNALQNPRIVPKKGAQGLVFGNNWVKDIKTGETFYSPIKMKFLGIWGDMRVFAKKETHPEVEVYVFCSVQSHTH